MRTVPCSELSEADFANNPVWRFALPSERSEDTDETHVRPDSDGLRLGTYGSYLVQARFALSNGESAPGAVQVDILGQRVFFTPAFLYLGGEPVDPMDGGAGRMRAERWTLNEIFAGEARPRSARIFHSTIIQLLAILVQLFRMRFARGG
jgi:hypothetical protein